MGKLAQISGQLFEQLHNARCFFFPIQELLGAAEQMDNLLGVCNLVPAQGQLLFFTGL